MLGSVEVEAPFELEVPMFVHNWRALEARQKKFQSLLGFLFTGKQLYLVSSQPVVIFVDTTSTGPACVYNRIFHSSLL